jgi:glycosyltransferase involved in cell wall biosynthesis
LDSGEQASTPARGKDAVTQRRILVVSPWASRWSLGAGAGVSDDHYFIDILSRRGHELHFLTPRPRTQAAKRLDGVTVHTYSDFFRATAGWPVPLKRVAWPALFNLIVTPRTLSLARKIKPDFVLGHSHYSALPCLAVRTVLGIPAGVKLFGVMDLVHSEWPKWKYYYKNIEQIAALKLPQDVWIILDDGTRGREAAMRHGVPEGRIRFLPNGINLEWAARSYDRVATRAEFGIDDDSSAVLFLARLVASKRPEAFVEAARTVLDRTKRPVSFVVAGDGPSRESCETLARSLGLGESMRFAGPVEHAKVPALMSSCDVFVSTSRLTNVAIPTCEAMVCGLPVVGFDVGTTRGVIADGETGIVVRDGDTSALADAIVRLVEDEVLRRRMGDAARRRAKAIFTGWEARVGEEVSIIDSLVRARGGPRKTGGRS